MIRNKKSTIKSYVLYLRSGENTPDFLEVEVVFPDGKIQVYRIPTVKLNEYTKDKITVQTYRLYLDEENNVIRKELVNTSVYKPH